MQLIGPVRENKGSEFLCRKREEGKNRGRSDAMNTKLRRHGEGGTLAQCRAPGRFLEDYSDAGCLFKRPDRHAHCVQFAATTPTPWCGRSWWGASSAPPNATTDGVVCGRRRGALRTGPPIATSVAVVWWAKLGVPADPPKKTMTDGVVVRPTVGDVEPPRQQCLRQGQITPTRVPSALDCLGSASPPPAQTVGAGGSDGPRRQHGCHAAAVRQRDTQVWASTRGRSVVRAGDCSRRDEPRQRVGGQRLVVAGVRQAEAGGRQGQTSGCGRRPTVEGGWWLQADCTGSSAPEACGPAAPGGWQQQVSASGGQAGGQGRVRTSGNMAAVAIGRPRQTGG